MPIPAGFLAAILADPEDDTPRLILADWLTDHGQEERAHFIRHQILFQFSDGRKIGHTADVMKEAERGPLPPVPLPGLTFRRGFVECVTLSADDWLTHADEILSCHPLQEVTMTTGILWSTDGERITLLDRLGRSRRLCEQTRLADWNLDASTGKQPHEWTTEDVTQYLLSREWPRIKHWHLPPV